MRIASCGTVNFLFDKDKAELAAGDRESLAGINWVSLCCAGSSGSPVGDT